jgi:flagellar motor switch protein FliM
MDATDSSNVLSQTEVEAILASIATDPTASQTTVVGGKKERSKQPASIQHYDFRSPVFLTPAELRRLRIKHEEFVRGLSASLSMFLRMEFGITMSKLETISYRNTLEALPVPSHLTLFRLKPLNGMCLFDISPRLGLTIMDRMLGGPGHSIKEEREFTDIEKVVLQNFIAVILREYADSWLRYQKLEWEMVENENTARFLNIVEPDEIMLFLEMEARFGDCVAGMRFIIPYLAIEGLVARLMQEISAEKKAPVTVPKAQLELNNPRFQIPVPISAHWEGFTVSLNELQSLEVGDVLVLDSEKCKQAVLNLGQLPKFVCHVDRNRPHVMITVNSKLE